MFSFHIICVIISLINLMLNTLCPSASKVHFTDRTLHRSSRGEKSSGAHVEVGGQRAGAEVSERFRVLGVVLGGSLA